MKFRTSGLLVVSALATVLVLASGCSAVKNMQDTTDHVAQDSDAMKGNMDKMVDKTDHMSGKTDHLATATDDLLGLTTQVQVDAAQTYYKLRQGNTLQARKDAIDHLNAAKKMEDKIYWGGVYFQGFEYQLFDSKYDDSQDRLDDLYNCAMQELYRETSEYLPEGYTHSPKVDPTKTDNNSMNLYALAVTMHLKNILETPEVIDASNPNSKPQKVSMYDLLQRGLALRKSVNAGTIRDTDLKDWQKEVLSDEQAFEYLIRVRENFLPVMSLAKFSRISENGLLGIPGLVRKLSMLFDDWTADLSSLNVEQIVTFTKWISDSEGALGAREVLNRLGVDSSINDNVLKIYRNMKIDESRVQPGAKLAGSDGSCAIRNLKQARADLINVPLSDKDKDNSCSRLPAIAAY